MFKNILIGFIAGAGCALFIYILSKVQMRAWIKVIEEHFEHKYKLKKDGNKEKK